MAVELKVENVFKQQDVSARKQRFNEHLAHIISMQENEEAVNQKALKQAG